MYLCTHKPKTRKAMYVTFTYYRSFTSSERIAVKCENEDVMYDVAHDLTSLCSIYNIRLCRKSKPKCDTMMSSRDYYNMFWRY